jgi:surfactin synthase thioesterase subunit
VPYAGGGAAAFRLWATGLPSTVDVVVAQLPGRESRLAERPLMTIDAMVHDLLLATRAHPELPTAIMGHSMGAVVAFELAHALRSAGLASPLHLFVSASRPPRLRDDGLPPLHVMADDDLVAEIDRRYGGIPAAVRQHRELMDLLLPMLRADITALETYTRRDRQPLSCPITAFAGTRDPRAMPSSMDAWSEETTGPFDARVFDGDHFFLNAHREALMAAVLKALENPEVQVGAA